MFSIAGLLGGFERQLARHRVEGRRHGDQHLLLRRRRIRHLANPRLRAGAPGSGGWLPPARSCRRLPARGTAAAARCGPRPNARARTWRKRPAGRRFPRRASAPAGPPRSARPASQGSAMRSRRKIGGAGQVEERGQQVFVAHLARIDKLRNGQQLARWRARRGRRPAGSPRRPARSWWCRGRCR